MRNAEGSVPRQKESIELGEEEISRMVLRRVVERDCWTRVLSRSAGWRRTAESIPEESPARKWKAARLLVYVSQLRVVEEGNVQDEDFFAEAPLDMLLPSVI